MRVFSDFYYIRHSDLKNNYSIWTIDDEIEMCGGFKTRAEAERMLAIMPHSYVVDDKQAVNDNSVLKSPLAKETRKILKNAKDKEL